jgi:hypothetical protein
MAKAKKKSPAKKAPAKEEPLKLDMTFEEAVRLSVQTKVPKKKK